MSSFANAKTGALCLYLLTILAKPVCNSSTLSFVKGLTFNTITQRQPAVKRTSAMSSKPARGVSCRLQRSSISLLLKASDCGRLSRCTSGTWKAAMFPASSSLLALVTRTHRDVTETTCWQHYQFPHDLGNSKGWTHTLLLNCPFRGNFQTNLLIEAVPIQLR